MAQLCKSDEDGLSDNRVVRLQVNQTISTGKWNLATSQDNYLLFRFEMGHEEIYLRIYPKGDSVSGSNNVTAYMYQPHASHRDNESASLAWAGRFQKQGGDQIGVSLEDDKTWTYRHGPEPATPEKRYGGQLMTTAEIPEHIIDGTLVFRAEIQLSMGASSSQLYVDKSIETHAFLTRLIQRLEEDKSDFTVKVSDGKTFPCHKVVLSAHSEYFKRLLQSGNGMAPPFNENLANEVTLEDIDYETMSLIMSYMYSKESMDPTSLFTRKSAIKLLVTADRLQMCQLVTMCTSFLMLDLKKKNLTKTFLLIDQFRPGCNATTDIFERMKKNKSAVSKSADFPLFVRKYPDLAVEFVQAVIGCGCGLWTVDCGAHCDCE